MLLYGFENPFLPFSTLFISLFILMKKASMETNTSKKMKIYIVDDHKLFREGLKLLLSTQDFINHIYEASNGSRT